MPLRESGARRWNRWTVRAYELARCEESKRFFACGGIDEGRCRRQQSQAEGAHRATLLVFVRLRRLMAAIIGRQSCFHRYAATGLDLRNDRLGGNGRQSERTRDRQAEKKSRCGQHQENIIALAVPGQNHNSMSQPFRCSSGFRSCLWETIRHWRRLPCPRDRQFAAPAAVCG